MTRRMLLLSAAACSATACAGGGNASRTPFFDAVRDAHARTKTFVVRHLDALVATRYTQRVADLARLPAIGSTRDPLAIAEAFDAILEARPKWVPGTTEPRWHLTFADAAGAEILVVTSSIFAPYAGTFGERRISFETSALVRFLTAHYAPREMKLLGLS